MARALLREEGADAFASGSLSAGDFLHNLSKQWASLPDPALGGRSHYGQRVGVPMDDALAQLAATKALAAQAFAPPGGAPNLLPPSAPLGATDPTALQPPSGQTIQLRGDLRIDGRKHGEYTANSLADRLTTPPSGPTQPNLRLTPGFVSAIPSFGGT